MVVVAYTPEWSRQFDSIKGVLERSVRRFERIEHVGSTSIPGMWAKPIIDIDIEIGSADDLEGVKKDLETIGYEYHGDQGVQDREVFKRRGGEKDRILDSIRHHLYVSTSLSAEYARHILFRDYLRRHAAYVDKYNAIKMELLNKYGEDNREKYVQKKEEDYGSFFDEVIELSRKEGN